MSELRKAAEMAMEALIWHDETVQTKADIEAIKALRAALDQTQQEPVAYQWLGTSVIRKRVPKTAEVDAWRPLYIHSHKHKPLTEVEIDEIIYSMAESDRANDRFSFARAVERAHGIGVEE